MRIWVILFFISGSLPINAQIVISNLSLTDSSQNILYMGPELKIKYMLRAEVMIRYMANFQFPAADAFSKIQARGILFFNVQWRQMTVPFVSGKRSISFQTKIYLQKDQFGWYCKVWSDKRFSRIYQSIIG